MPTRALKIICVAMCLTGLIACATYRPPSTTDLCVIFRGNTDWYEAARDARNEWGTPIHLMMAIMQQESHFVSDAQPERPWFLGIIPLPRSSSAYGYAQAKDETWDDYIRGSGNSGADREDFADSIDFIGWYSGGTHRALNISKWDAYGQYLAYHEGRGGYARKTYEKKPWLKKVAAKVRRRSEQYGGQLKVCQKDLDEQVDRWF
jgi:hypothetical protein